MKSYRYEFVGHWFCSKKYRGVSKHIERAGGSLREDLIIEVEKLVRALGG